MDALLSLMRSSGLLILIWQGLVWAAIAFLLVLGAACLFQPAAARRFLGGYAATPALNTLEAFLRFLAGLGFMGASPDMHFGGFMFALGAFLAVSAVGLAIFFRQHQRFARAVVPMAQRIVAFYGVFSIGLGCFLIFALTM